MMKNARFNICNTVDTLLFVGYQFSWISWVDVNHEFINVCLQTLAKLLNQISAKLQISLNLLKLVAMKITESTVQVHSITLYTQQLI